MDIKEAYKIMQAKWVKINNVQVGTVVKIIREYKTDEMGCAAGSLHGIDHWNEKANMVTRIESNYIYTEVCHPFFALEVVKQPEKMLMVQGKEYSESTIANALREYSK